MSSLAGLTNAQRTVVLRADASNGVGLGHVVRSLTLGAALVATGWKVVLVTTNAIDAITTRAHGSSIDVRLLRSQPHGSADAAEVIALQPDLVVADGYHFEPSFYESFTDIAPPLCLIDDNGENAHRCARVIINQNPGTLDTLYAYESATPALLLGLRHALIRGEIRAMSRSTPSNERSGVFVSMGGSDPLRLSERLATAFSRSGFLTRVVLGPAMDDRETVLDRVSRLPGVAVVTDRSFATAMDGAHVAVIGAGITMWEAACLGVPSISVIVADNQTAPARAAESIGFTISLDTRSGMSPSAIEGVARDLLSNAKQRSRMTMVGRASVDGRGADRVAAFLSEFTVDERRTPC